MIRFFLVLVFVVSSVFAQESNVSGFLGFGGTIPISDSEISGSVEFNGLRYDYSFDVETDSGLATRVGGRWALLEWLAVGASFDYSGVKLDQVEYHDTRLLNRLGTAHAFTLLVFVEFRLNTPAGIAPYCQIGGGVNFNHFEAKPDSVKNWLKEELSPALHFALGCEFFTDREVGLFFETRYLHNESDWEIRHTNADLEAKLSNVAIMAGITVHGFGTM